MNYGSVLVVPRLIGTITTIPERATIRGFVLVQTTAFAIGGGLGRIVLLGTAATAFLDTLTRPAVAMETARE